jgi:hypothetical protein
VTTTCVRRAWLTLDDGRRIDLEGRGYFCKSLDLGSPAVREVVNNRPDNTGTVDRTNYLGSRLVTADLTVLDSAGARIDEVASAFGPFMDPAARPTLHYVLDRVDDPERTLVLRGAAYGWPIAGPYERDVQLQWVAPDPWALDPIEALSTAWADPGRPGRTYDRTYDRTYPPGAGSPIAGRIVTLGDTWVRPLLRIYGPCSGPVVWFQPDGAPADTSTWFLVPFLASLNVDAGSYVTIDTDAHSAYMGEDHSRSVLSALDWLALRWPVISPGTPCTMTITTRSGATHTTQVQATWHDRYYA